MDRAILKSSRNKDKANLNGFTYNLNRKIDNKYLILSFPLLSSHLSQSPKVKLVHKLRKRSNYICGEIQSGEPEDSASDKQKGHGNGGTGAEPPKKSRGSGGGTPPAGEGGRAPKNAQKEPLNCIKKHTAVLVSSLVIVTKAVILAQKKSMLSGFEEFLILV